MASFRQLPYFPEAKLSSTFFPSILWKYSKTFYRQPENFQRLFRLQNCLSHKSLIFRKFSKIFLQQQQPAVLTSSSNHQQQPAKATSSSNQHSSYQQHLRNQRRPPLVINTVPSRGYPASS